MKKLNILSMLVLFSASTCIAQGDVSIDHEIFVLPQFLIIILSGVLLALGFKLS